MPQIRLATNKASTVEPGSVFDVPLSDGVFLRTLTSADAEVFAAHVADAHDHLRRHLPWPDRTRTVAGAREWLEAYANGWDGRVVAGGAWSGDRLVGGVTLLSHDPVRAVAELGVWVIPEMAGRGVAAAACRVAIGAARAELAVERLVWQCVAGNVASRRLAERLGFRFEGTLRSDYVLRGVRHDTDVLSLVGAELDAPS